MKQDDHTTTNPSVLQKKRIKPQHWQIISLLLILYDIAAIHIAYFFALWARFDLSFSRIPDNYLQVFYQTITIYSIASVIVFWIFRLYNTMWRFASYVEFISTLVASVLTSAVYSLVTDFLIGSMPLSYYIWGLLLQLMLLEVVRFSFRFLLYLRARGKQEEKGIVRVMLIGAGNAGQMILRDMRISKSISERVVCVIDDNPNKWGRFMNNAPIVGGRHTIPENVIKYKVDKIYLAIPSATMRQKKEILDICKDTGCEMKQLPGMYQFVLDEVTVNNMKNVSVEDLLGREPVRGDMQEVFDFIHGKRVLVTGGGGSIGSELCRQIAAHEPESLIIFDIYENNAYDIQLELKEKYPNLNLHVLIGSVRDSRKVFELFAQYHPQIVYHAAAHKHVPLMEDSPCESVKNNAIGTYKTAYAAMVNGCERFVLISTDKAVNPTNIMGASKRLCEMIIQSFDAKIKADKANEIPQLFTHKGEENADRDGTGKVFQGIKTEFVAVRFGNVLGSNGSVIPIFKKQIEKGGPVTVTHPDIIRYFMTIPEAVSLVMLAGTYAKGGEIFVLDMGSPVKIDDLARNLIKLSGYKPDVDIMIEYTGLRPGEKLYEERLMAEEGLRKTPNEMIHIGSPIPFDTDWFLEEMDELMRAAYANKENIRELVAAVVTTYRPEDLRFDQ